MPHGNHRQLTGIDKKGKRSLNVIKAELLSRAIYGCAVGIQNIVDEYNLTREDQEDILCLFNRILDITAALERKAKANKRKA